MALLANDPIMSGRLIRSFRHLECQNLSIISESIGIPNGSKKKGKKSEEEEDSYIYRVNLLNFWTSDDTKYCASVRKVTAHGVKSVIIYFNL